MRILNGNRVTVELPFDVVSAVLQMAQNATATTPNKYTEILCENKEC
jgi:hypothetical protein